MLAILQESGYNVKTEFEFRDCFASLAMTKKMLAMTKKMLAMTRGKHSSVKSKNFLEFDND